MFQPKRKLRVPFGLIMFAIIGALYWYFSQPRFSVDEINRIKTDIKLKFEERKGVHVIDIDLIKENDRKLMGLVKLKIDGLDEEITKSCSARMGDDSRYIWECQ